VKIKITLRSPLQHPLDLTIPAIIGGVECFLPVRLRHTECGWFGSDVDTLEKVEWQGREVPLILELLKDELIKCNGLKKEGIFRINGDIGVCQQLKQAMNKKKFAKTSDAYNLATLIKLWFREMPQPLFSPIPASELMKELDEKAATAIVETLPEQERSILFWLLDLLAMTALHHGVNMMTPQNLAICVAPNLWRSKEADPMVGLVLSQKSVQFLSVLLLWYIKTNDIGEGTLSNIPRKRTIQISPAPENNRLTLAISTPVPIIQELERRPRKKKSGFSGSSPRAISPSSRSKSSKSRQGLSAPSQTRARSRSHQARGRWMRGASKPIQPKDRAQLVQLARMRSSNAMKIEVISPSGKESKTHKKSIHGE